MRYASYPGTPASSIVGMSGAPTVRLSLVTPSARSLTLLMEKSAKVLNPPDEAALKFRQGHMSAVDVVEDGRDFHILFVLSVGFLNSFRMEGKDVTVAWR